MKRFLALVLLMGCQAAQPTTPARRPTPMPLGSKVVLPGDVRVTRDLKPRLSQWGQLSPQCGLTLAPEALYYALPNCIHALRWEAIHQISVYETTVRIEVEKDDPVLELPGIELNSANEDYWTPRLPAKELLPELVRYAGLNAQGEGRDYLRAGGKAQPPKQRRFIPLLTAGPVSLNLPPQKLARLSSGLGLFLNGDGVILAEPTQVSSIAWKQLGHVEDRYDGGPGDPIVYLGLNAQSTVGEYQAICWQGPSSSGPLLYLSGPDYLKATLLVKARKAPARAQHFSLSSCLPQMGEARPDPIPKDAFVPVSAPAANDAWPGQALANVHPLASGVYLLPAGFIKLQPKVIEYAAWNEIHGCGVDLQGNAVVYAREGIELEDRDLRRAPQMRALSRALLEILRFQPGPDDRLGWGSDSPERKIPKQGRFFALGSGKWDWPPLEELGREAWKPGLHLQRDALVACLPNYIEVFLWEDLASYRLDKDGLLLRDFHGSGQRFPSCLNNLPPELIENAWKKLPAYWKFTGKNEGQGEEAGAALPRHLRPTQVQHFPVR